jgi:sugar/nucleoside kinase (ribokinase family)
MTEVMESPLDLMCAADLCVDVILRGNVRPQFNQVEQLIGDYEVELGGSATIFASQWARLAGTVGILGTVGRDLFGGFVHQRLKQIGLSTDRVRDIPNTKTGVGFTLTEPEDRAILTFNGTIDGVGPEDLTDALASACRHWHVASYFLLDRLRPHWAIWLKKLKNAGVTTSLDPNWSPDGRWDAIWELLPLLDIFLCNENEAKAITGQRHVAAAGEKLAASGPIVVIKKGERGATAFRGMQQWETPISDDISTSPPVDTIGAGDCFDAGFIRAWQVGRPINRCLELASRCGRASLRAPGGFAGQVAEVVR